MLAVFKTGGKQYSVKAGQILKVEKLEGNKGDNVSFNDVLAVTDDFNHTIGSPLIKGASVQAKILEQIRDKKIIVFKKRRRQNYRHTQGHRQYLTVLQIESIAMENKKSSFPGKKAADRKAPVKKETKITSSITKKKATPKKSTSVKKSVLKKKITTKTKK